MNFIALSQAIGLDQGTDGILGLSPDHFKDNEKYHLLGQLKQAGAIDQAMVSFSINESGGSYAVFGGIDASQVVGGQSGMHFAKNVASKTDTWALEG